MLRDKKGVFRKVWYAGLDDVKSMELYEFGNTGSDLISHGTNRAFERRILEPWPFHREDIAFPIKSNCHWPMSLARAENARSGFFRRHFIKQIYTIVKCVSDIAVSPAVQQPA
jgi:hypothetical protein